MVQDATPTAPARPGFDGATFAEEPLRDHEGKGKRESGFILVRYDVVDRLYHKKVGPKPRKGEFDCRQGLISLLQWDAACRLQADDEFAKTVVQARWGETGGGGGSFGISETILDARGRVRLLETILAARFWPVVSRIVLKNVEVAQTARALDVDQGRVVPRLRDGLDIVSKFYDREPSACES